MDYRDFAVELTEDMGFSAEEMLVACLKYMSQDDVKDMLEVNEYPMSCEEDDEVEDFAPPESLSALMDEADRVFGSNAI